MFKIYKIIILVLIILMFYYCGKKGKMVIIDNPMHPDVETIQPRLIRSIIIPEDVGDISKWIVADNKVYLCSMPQKAVTIIDFEGNLIKRLDSVGKGPGEFSLPQTIINDKTKSRIEVFDTMNRRSSFFTYDGQYIEDKNLTSLVIPQDRINLGEYLLEFVFKMNMKNDKMVVSPTIQITKPDTTIILKTTEVELATSFRDPSKFTYAYACDNKYAYVAPVNIEEYVIDVYNFEGEKIKEIRKKYKKIEKSPEEIAAIEERVEKYQQMIKNMNKEIDIDFPILKYQNSINQLLIDEENNLWVNTYYYNKDKYYEHYFDIIDKRGKIIKRCKIDENSFGERIYNDKLIELIKNPDDDSITMNIKEILH